MTLGSTTFGRQSNATSRLRRRLRLRWLLGSFVGIVLLCGLVYIGICSYMAVSLTRVERHPFTRSPETYGLAYESVNFPSRIDAISLDGWLLPASGNPARFPVIVVHGKGSDRQAEAGGHTLDIAAQLVRDGHPVLLFDLRGSGRSAGIVSRSGRRRFVMSVGPSISSPRGAWRITESTRSVFRWAPRQR